MSDMTIGQFAIAAGVNRETVRYYENKKLMPRPKKNRGGYRVYDDADLKRMFFIVRAKKLGFTLNEVKELLRLKASPSKPSSYVKAIAEMKIRQVENKTKELNVLKRALKKMASRCDGKGSVSECPILDALDGKFFDKLSVGER